MGFCANLVFNLHAGVRAFLLSTHEARLSTSLILNATADLHPSCINTVPWIVEGLVELIRTGDPSAVRAAPRPLRPIRSCHWYWCWYWYWHWYWLVPLVPPNVSHPMSAGRCASPTSPHPRRQPAALQRGEAQCRTIVQASIAERIDCRAHRLRAALVRAVGAFRPACPERRCLPMAPTAPARASTGRFLSG